MKDIAHYDRFCAMSFGCCRYDIGIYSTLVNPAVPVGISRLVISMQMRCPFLNKLAVANISMAYSLISPGTTSCWASLVKGCQGFKVLIVADPKPDGKPSASLAPILFPAGQEGFWFHLPGRFSQMDLDRHPLV